MTFYPVHKLMSFVFFHLFKTILNGRDQIFTYTAKTTSAIYTELGDLAAKQPMTANPDIQRNKVLALIEAHVQKYYKFIWTKVKNKAWDGSHKHDSKRECHISHVVPYLIL